MPRSLGLLLIAATAWAQTAPPQPPAMDAVRVGEFYRLAGQIAGQVWPAWQKTSAPILLVTDETEFLFHYNDAKTGDLPTDFRKISDDLYARKRQYPTSLLATFPVVGQQSVIVIGAAENTDAKTSTPWLITLMHEHFHQLQDNQPGIFDAVKALGLARGDETGMWMLNYPFPYDKPELGRSFAALRDLLLAALSETDQTKFQVLAQRYSGERAKFLAQLSADDRKYLSFEIWKEGIARYVEVRSAEAAARYRPTAAYAALPDYEAFASYAARARGETLKELKGADLTKWQRVVVYSFGAGEGFLLDRVNPNWRDGYFQNLFTLDPYFTR